MTSSSVQKPELEDDGASEALRRAEASDEAGRRHRVKRLLSDWQTLHDVLEPETTELEVDECDAASRIEEGDTLDMALEREVARTLGRVPKMTPASLTLRLVNAYDDDFAFSVDTLPEHAVSAERVYAHLLSFESVKKLVPAEKIRSIARIATVLLLNRRFLCRTKKTPAAESPVRRAAAESAVAPAEPSICLECGRDTSAPGPGCEACEKTVSPA